jgi:hypothetical protein
MAKIARAHKASVVQPDPDLPPEVDLSRGRRGVHLPADPVARARVLEQRVILLQRYSARLRRAAERVYQSAVTEEQDGSRGHVDVAALEALRQALYEME